MATLDALKAAWAKCDDLVDAYNAADEIDQPSIVEALKKADAEAGYLDYQMHKAEAEHPTDWLMY